LIGVVLVIEFRVSDEDGFVAQAKRMPAEATVEIDRGSNAPEKIISGVALGAENIVVVSDSG
jgi:hypothetical protein